MKKILTIAIAALLSTFSFGQNKFAHVNYTEICQLCPEADAMRETMRASYAEVQKTDQEMIAEMQKKYQAYQANAATWSASTKEMKEKELADLQQRVQEFENNAQQELQQQQQQLLAPILNKAKEVVEKLGKEGGYVYVFDDSNLLYKDPGQSDDLTQLARREMNIPEGRTLEALQAEIAAAAEAMAK